MSKRTILTAVASLAVATAVPTAVNATVLTFSVGDVTSGSFGDAHIKKGAFTDTVSFSLFDAGTLSASLTSAATKLKKAGDLDFTSVVLTGGSGPFAFDIVNNGGPTLTDSATFTGFLGAGSYLLTIKGTSYGNAQFGGNTTVEAVPEVASWLMMLAGFGAVGAGLRRRRSSLTFA